MKFEVGNVVQFFEFADPTGPIYSLTILDYDDKKGYQILDGNNPNHAPVMAWMKRKTVEDFCWLKTE